MALSEKEKMQIRDVVDKVVEARLVEFSEVQLTLISDMLIRMTDHYVEALMKLARLMTPDNPSSEEEGERVAAMLLQGLRAAGKE